MNYVFVLCATLLLAFDFALSKLYQKKSGVGITAGLSFNAINGLFTAVVFFALNGFKFTFSAFSVVMAFAMAAFALTYSLIGFRILRDGNMAMYTLFLMTGGMILPYIYGLLALDEPLRIIRIVGLAVIIAAVAFSNSGTKKPTKLQIVLCVAVFVLNGMVSIISKAHQVDTLHTPVNTTEFVMLSGIAKFIMSSTALIFTKLKTKDKLPQPVNLLPLALANAVVGGVSYMLQLIGAQNLPATVLYPCVTGGSIIFSAFAGKIFFKENITKAQWISIGLCFAGTCMFL